MYMLMLECCYIRNDFCMNDMISFIVTDESDLQKRA